MNVLAACGKLGVSICHCLIEGLRDFIAISLHQTHNVPVQVLN